MWVNHSITLAKFEPGFEDWSVIGSGYF